MLHGAFSSCSEWRLLFVAVCVFLVAVASRCRVQVLGAQASVVVIHGLSCSVACGIPILGIELVSPAFTGGLLYHAGSPITF